VVAVYTRNQPCLKGIDHLLLTPTCCSKPVWFSFFCWTQQKTPQL